jgi:hypothetical protein
MPDSRLVQSRRMNGDASAQDRIGVRFAERLV